MQEGTIGRRYARALAESLGAGGQIDKKALGQVEGELSALGALMTDKKSEFRQAMLNPSFSSDQRQAILRKVAEDNKFHAATRVFLDLLVEKDRLPYLALIAQSFRDEVDERIGRVRAKIVSARKLEGGAVDEIVGVLEKRTGKSVVAEVEVDPAVISGVSASIGGLVFDGTLKAQLDRLRAELR